MPRLGRRALSLALACALALAAGARTPTRAAHFDLPSYVAPNGRLVLTASTCSNTTAPVMTADVSAATVVCYIPYNGKVIVVGGTPYIFPRLTLALSQTSHISGSNYDIWAVASSGAVVLCAEGSFWSSNTARSSTPNFSSGVLSNPVSLTDCYNGSTDYGPVAIGAATYLGSFTVPTATATTVSSQSNSSTTLTVGTALTGAGLYGSITSLSIPGRTSNMSW